PHAAEDADDLFFHPSRLLRPQSTTAAAEMQGQKGPRRKKSGAPPMGTDSLLPGVFRFAAGAVSFGSAALSADGPAAAASPPETGPCGRWCTEPPPAWFRRQSPGR